MVSGPLFADLSIRSQLLQILERYKINRRPLVDSTALNTDLVVLDSDDAFELFEEIHKTFGTDFSGLNPGDYFLNCEESMFIRVRYFFGYKIPKPQLTFKHLVDVVERGRWFDPS